MIISPTLCIILLVEAALNLNVQQESKAGLTPSFSLELETPGTVNEYSARPFKEKIEEWAYPDYCEVRRVTKNGALRWKSTKGVMVATSLIDKHVGLEELGDGIWRIYFRQKMLGYFNEKELRTMDELGRLKRN